MYVNGFSLVMAWCRQELHPPGRHEASADFASPLETPLENKAVTAVINHKEDPHQ